jgi:hypothetical protein
MGQSTAEAAAPSTADAHNTASERGAAQGARAAAVHATNAATTTRRDRPAASAARVNRPALYAASAYAAPMTPASRRFRAAENPYWAAVTKKMAAQKTPPLIEPKKVTDKTAASGAGRSAGRCD